MEWDVKQDWPDSTGAIKFEILCQDGSRDKPVDLHFLKLPFADGNMTISRSPLKDSDFVNYAKFLLATGQAQFESNTSNAVIFLQKQTLRKCLLLRIVERLAELVHRRLKFRRSTMEQICKVR